ncbi:MAG: hypothetical protein PVF56_24580 [Desulfobacterales bacterium]
MKSYILTLIFLVTINSSFGWGAGLTHDRPFEGNGTVLVEKQIEGFLCVDGRGVYSSDNTLLMVEIEKIRFYELPEYAELDSSFWLPQQIQCFPEDRFEGDLFIRETSCNNGYGTTICRGTTCVGDFVFTDDVGSPTGRTRSSIQKLKFKHKKAKIVCTEKLDGEELFKIVGTIKEKE